MVSISIWKPDKVIVPMKNLFVLPGGGNPDTDPVYQNVYEPFERQVVKYRYGNVYAVFFCWPCHVGGSGSYNQKPASTRQEALKSVVNAIKALPDGPYSLLARLYLYFLLGVNRSMIEDTQT